MSYLNILAEAERHDGRSGGEGSGSTLPNTTAFALMAQSPPIIDASERKRSTSDVNGPSTNIASTTASADGSSPLVRSHSFGASLSGTDTRPVSVASTFDKVRHQRRMKKDLRMTTLDGEGTSSKTSKTPRPLSFPTGKEQLRAFQESAAVTAPTTPTTADVLSFDLSMTAHSKASFPYTPSSASAPATNDDHEDEDVDFFDPEGSFEDRV